MIGELFNSVNAYSKASAYLFKPWAVKYVVVSAIISFLTFATFIVLILLYGDNIIQPLFRFIYPDFLELDWLVIIFEWLARIIFLLLVIFLFKYIVLIVTAPVMSLLSESVEINVSSRQIPRLGFKDQIKSVVRGTIIAVGNLSRELLIALPVLIMSIIPGLAIATTPLLLIVQSYFAGFGNFDFFMERRFGVRQSRNFMNKHKGLAVGNGVIYLSLLFIPIVGVLFAPALATVAATLSGLEYFQDNEPLADN